MIDQNEQLPEGTDSIVSGAAVTTDNQDQVIIANPRSSRSASTDAGGLETDTSAIGQTADTGTIGQTGDTNTSRRSKVVEQVKSGSNKLAGQAADKTRGFVGQGLERSSEALANVSRMVGDTAAGIDERLGQEYGDYARKAAGAIDSAANSLASKSPDELIDDTREFVKRSPGIALAGAAVVGFALARLVKSGLDSDKPEA